MAASPVLADPALTTLEEYLDTVYHPDREYIDGKITERNLGETPHGKLQAFFVRYLGNRRDEWRVDAIPEERVQVAPTRYRIADVCLVSYDAPDELILTTPPVLCIEVLSRRDTVTETIDRAEDYLRMGVPAVWIVDPWKRRAYTVTGDGTLQRQTELLTVPGTPIQVPIPEIFAELDRKRS